MDLLARVRRTIERQALAEPGCRVLIGLSGGADSVAMLWLLRELERDGALTIAAAAHLNHQLRGADADGDEAFCAALAARIAVPFVSERVDVAALARAQKRSIEDAGRSARYAFFERAADACAADRITVAHTKDDQAETFLLRLLRGAGTRGLAAIRPRAGRVIRPLLDVHRSELRRFLADRGEAFREDASNADVAIPRNRVRHELMPLLELRFSPAVTDVLAREAALARRDEEFLEGEAIKLAARIVLRSTAGTTELDARELTSAPAALSSRIVMATLQRLAGRRPIHFDHVERVLALAESAEEGRAVSLPGQDAVRTGTVIVLRRSFAGSRSRATRESAAGGNSFAVSLSIPGEVELEGPGLAIAAEALREPAGAPARWRGRGTEVGVSTAAVELPLAVRSRRPGDRFRPLGAPGVRKLQDFFVDRKVGREARDTVPLVVDGRDRIVWVVGQSVAEDFRVTDPAQGVILLKVRHLGGPG